MTLKGEVKALLRRVFGAAFSEKLLLQTDDRAPDVIVLDFMQFVKSIPKEHVTLMGDLISYFVKRALELLWQHPTANTLVIMVDGEPLDAKRAVAHRERESRTPALPLDGAPYLPSREQDCVMGSDRWQSFARSHLLLRRELYPRLFDAFMNLRDIPLPEGKEIVLSGFPGRTGWRAAHMRNPWEAPRNNQGAEQTVLMWEGELPITEAVEKADPGLYERTWVVANRGPNAGGIVRYEWERARNSISEGDVRMFWFTHFWPHAHVLLAINDGDVFSIGLLHAQERLKCIAPVERTYVFHNRHTVVMPNRSSDYEGRFTYINLNNLYSSVREYEPLRRANVQHPAATVAALITMNGTDFSPKFVHGVGWQNIWNTFFSNAPLFSHMVMISDALPGNTRRWREVVIDEDAYEQLMRMCFAFKYDRDLLAQAKRNKRTPSEQDLRKRSRTKSGGKPQDDTRFHWPESRNVVRAYARATLWTLQYWKNAPAGEVPDALEKFRGMPYYPYWLNPSTQQPEFVTLVSAHSKPVDEVYRRRHEDMARSLERVRKAHKRALEYADEDAIDALKRQANLSTRVEVE